MDRMQRASEVGENTHSAPFDERLRLASKNNQFKGKCGSHPESTRRRASPGSGKLQCPALPWHFMGIPKNRNFTTDATNWRQNCQIALDCIGFPLFLNSKIHL
jgi:hypothetical protein